MSPTPIYLDHQASTPLDPRVAAVMERYVGCYGNPHTTSHSAGIDAGKAVNVARRQIARAIGGDARRVVFTSGATEANNLAIFGAARANCGRSKAVTVATEHGSVLEPALALRDEGLKVEVVPVRRDGRVDLRLLESIVDEQTNIVSVMHINNETGVVQPIAEIAEICHRAGAVLHSDCAQSMGRMPVDVNVLGADLFTLSAHKCYGPKGIGALYVGGRPRIVLKPLSLGGGQESGLRPGTVPVPLCVAFGEACRISAEEVQVDADRMGRLGARLLGAILHVCPSARLNGSHRHRAPGALNVCFPGATGDELICALEGVQVSSGSACASAVLEPSRVLLAHGLTNEEAESSLRICVGRFTTEEEISLAEEVIRQGLCKLGL
ncbi:MAG: cysteine desulfurase [Proteobacteria bacterium]|nr:cysteine desulfurase [Pseudomonadota bacterium]